MNALLQELKRQLRQAWYRRRYYRGQVWPPAVPPQPLGYLPPGFRVRQVAATGLRVVDHFVTPEEAKWLINAAREHLARSTVVVDGRSRQDSGRTSANAVVFHRYAQDPKILPLLARGAMLAGVPPDHAEQIYVSRYGPGELYHGHFDTAPGFLTADRLCTLLVYLNDLEPAQGGATYFRDLRVAVQPRLGRAVCWTNTNPDGSTHPETAHAALPPHGAGSEKWVAQLWFRPYRMHRIRGRLAPLQAKTGKPLASHAGLPDGVSTLDDSR